MLPRDLSNFKSVQASMHLLNRIKCRASSPYWLEYGNLGQNNAILTEKCCKAVHLAHNYIALYITQSCKNYKPYIAKTVSEIVSYWKYPSMPQILRIFWQHLHLTHWGLGKMSTILKPQGHWYFNVKIKYMYLTYLLEFHLDVFSVFLINHCFSKWFGSRAVSSHYL